MSQARITITIPAGLVAAADTRARSVSRSRSWVLVEALRAYLAGGAASAAPPIGRGLGAGRQAQLEADLGLTPEERVRLAEKTALVGVRRRGQSRRHQLLTFDRVEDFHAWERREGLDL